MKSATEILAEQRVHGVQIAYRAEYIIKALNDAGYVIAPKEPTPDMCAVGFMASPHDVGGCRDQIASDEEWMQEAVIDVYDAMIAAVTPQ